MSYTEKVKVPMALGVPEEIVNATDYYTGWRIPVKFNGKCVAEINQTLGCPITLDCEIATPAGFEMEGYVCNNMADAIHMVLHSEWTIHWIEGLSKDEIDRVVLSKKPDTEIQAGLQVKAVQND